MIDSQPPSGGLLTIGESLLKEAADKLTAAALAVNGWAREKEP